MREHSRIHIDTRQCGRHSGVTLRAFIVGLLGVIFVTAYTPYNDYVLGNTFFVGNHLPLGIILLMTLLAIMLNSVVKRFFEGAHFSSSELIVVFSMMMASAGFATAGLHRYWANGLALPFYLTDTVRPTWTKLVAQLDPRLFPSTDPTERVIEGFARGDVYFYREPALWGPWIRSMAVWAVFLLPMFVGFLCVCIIVRKQWVYNESLTFPLAQFGLELVREPEPGRLFNDFFRNRMMWLGMSVPSLLFLLHGLAQYYPKVPEVKLAWQLGGLFNEHPWSLVNQAVYNGQLYLSMVAIAVIIPADVAFSIWFFFIFVCLTDAAQFWIGLPWRDEPRVAQHMGGYLMVMFTLIYAGRTYFKEVARASWDIIRFRRPAKEGEQGWALITLILCCALCWGWLCEYGMGWRGMGPVWALMLVVMLMAMNIVAGRVIAEAGVTLFQHRWWPVHACLSIIGIRVMGLKAVMMVALMTLVVGHDLRECLLPYLLNNTRMAEASARIQHRRYTAAIIVAMLVSIFFGAVVHLGIDYYWGPKRHEHWALFNSFNYILGSVQGHERTPLPVARNVMHFTGGAALVAFLSFMRGRLAWWPFHPIGFIMAHTWPASIMWPSICLGWFIKLSVMRYGGSKTYYKIKPALYGVLLGECMIGGVWMIVTAVLFWLGREPHRIVLLPL
ncbi:MAG TPA: hypothetical protein PL033_18365 [Candidatus Brocadiia bacterium]|nr:hypothetical protein [Candidatus Brocadiia bacterium]